MHRFLSNTKLRLEAQLRTGIQMPDNRDLPPILARLDSSDKEYLCSAFIDSDWNAGSRHVMELLQNARILSTSDYVYHKCKVLNKQSTMLDYYDDDDGGAADDRVAAVAEHIFNDLLDGNYELLADVVFHLNGTHAKSLMLSELLDSGVRRLIVDLRLHPELQHRCYFRILQKSTTTLPAHKVDAFRSMHVKHVLALEEHTAYEAIGLLAEWKTTPANASLDGKLSGPLDRLMRACVEAATGTTTTTVSAKCAELLAMVQVIGFTGWRWWLHLWRLLISDASVECFVTIRQLLKELFRRFLGSQTDSSLYVMLICARWTAGLRGDKGDFGSYADWFKWTFGEMSTVVKVDEFRRTIESLSKVIAHERDVEALTVVAETRFATPPHCSEAVRGLKAIARSWMSDLRRKECAGSAENDDDDVIMMM